MMSDSSIVSLPNKMLLLWRIKVFIKARIATTHLTMVHWINIGPITTYCIGPWTKSDIGPTYFWLLVQRKFANVGKTFVY